MIKQTEELINQIANSQKLTWQQALEIRYVTSQTEINFNVEEYNDHKVNVSNETWKLYLKAIDEKINSILFEMNQIYTSLPDKSDLDFKDNYEVKDIPSKTHWRWALENFSKQTKFVAGDTTIAPILG